MKPIIINQAGIYFDRNDVVLTNTTLNTLYDNPNPIADFKAKHSCASTDIIYDFIYTGGTSDSASYLWNFGAGAIPSTSTLENPTGISFINSGSKVVTLTINRYGCTATVCRQTKVHHFGLIIYV